MYVTIIVFVGHDSQIMVHISDSSESDSTVNVTDPEQLVQAMEKTSALFDRLGSLTYLHSLSLSLSSSIFHLFYVSACLQNKEGISSGSGTSLFSFTKFAH